MRSVPGGATTPIAVAIVSYNTRALLHACLASIEPSATPVVVVDNASEDGSPEMVREQFPHVTLLANATNGGYGAAANQAIAACQTPYVLLLNADTELVAGALDVLRTTLDRDPTTALVGPRLEGVDGQVQPSCYPFPTPLHLFLEESTLGRLARYLPGVRERYLRSRPLTRGATVPWVLGAALAIRRSAFEAVGGFDPRYFMYYEEVDLCYRLRAAGWRVTFQPAAIVRHVGGASTGQESPRMARELYRSAALFYDRHYTGWQRRQLRLVVALVMALRAARDRLRQRLSRDPDRRRAHLERARAWERILVDAQRGWLHE